MPDGWLENPWLFTLVVIVVWVVVWVSLELFVFQVDLIGAVIIGALTGLVMGMSYIAIRTRMEQ